MSTMTLAEARIKLNMPFESDAEVRSAAQRSNIQIIDLNLGGIKNTANLNDLNNNLAGSLFGASTTLQTDMGGSVFGNQSGFQTSGFTFNFDFSNFFSSQMNEGVTPFAQSQTAQIQTSQSAGSAETLAEAKSAEAAQTADVKETDEVDDVKDKKPDAEEVPDADSEVWAKNKKNGPSVTETLTKFYGSRFEKASPEGKEQLLVKYFDWLNKDKKDTVSQARQWELYKQRCTSPEEYRFLCGVIDKMQAEQQAKAADSAMTRGTKEQRRIGRSEILRDMNNYDPGARKQIKARYGEIYSSVAPEEQFEMDAENQNSPDLREQHNEIVRQWFSDQPAEVQERFQAEYDKHVERWQAAHPGEEVPENVMNGIMRRTFIMAQNTEIPQERRIEYGKKAIDVLQNLSEEHQQDGVKEAYGINSEVDVYMAQKTVDLCAEAQRLSVELGMQLENEDVNDIFANDAYKYDISNREDIIRMIKEQGTEKTLEILDNARKEYEAQDADNKAATALLEEAKKQRSQAEPAQSNVQTPQKKTQQTKQNISTRPSTHQVSGEEQKSFATSRFAAPRSYTGLTPVQTYVMSDEFKSADMRTKQDYINKLNVSDKKQAVAALVETATPAQLTAYMYSGLKKNILSYLVNNPGGKNTETLKYLSGFLSGPDKEFVKQLEEERNKLLGIKNTSSNVDFTQQRKNPFNFEA